MKREMALVVGLALAIYCAALAQDSLKTQSGTIRGTVVDTLTGEPLPTALVFHNSKYVSSDPPAS